MRLTVSQQEAPRHGDMCTALSINHSGVMLSGGDDHAVWRWTAAGEPQSKIIEGESCVTLVSWLPGAGRKKGDARDAFLVAFANGQLHFVNAADGRVEKRIEAHQGAVTGLAWSPDGGTMATAGEDGMLKVWSQSGVQRSTLVTSTKSIHCLVWGADSPDYGGTCVLYTHGPDVAVKPLNPAVKKQLQWRAHNGTVLCASWSPMSNLIATGGEDGTYRVWDAYGRALFTSAASEYPVTSVRFSPDGEMFAVGSFMSLRICDKSGWTQCRESVPNAGSVMALNWTPDSTQVAMGTASGHLMLAQLVDRVFHWRNFRCSLADRNKLVVEDMTTKNTEVLEHRDTIIKVSIGFSHLIVATTTQCTVYAVERWSQPVQFDLRDVVVSIQQCERCFFIADCTLGIQVYSYEGRQTAVIKIGASIRPELLTNNLVSLSHDTCAIRDPADSKRIIFFDAINGRPIKDLQVAHHLDVLELALSQYGPQQDRKLAFVDRNRDLYLVAIHSRLPTQKLATMVSSAAWNDSTETLTAIADCRLVTWYYPSAVFVDRDLLVHTKHVRGDEDSGDDLGRNDHIIDFFGTRASVRRGSDGALLTFGVSPYPSLLFAALAKSDWVGAIRLCRFIRDNTLWGILAAVAVKQNELHTAEVAYAALEDVDKLRYMSRVREIPTSEGRQAELALFQRRVDEAESILLQAGYTYRAIDMHIGLHAWERAIKLAVERRAHIDTVLHARQKHLESIGRSTETLHAYRQAAQSAGKVDAAAVAEKVKQEHDKEKERGKPYVPPKGV
uniref:Guanine nucleotide-binding protein subunit beta-like protein n=1 Tax=Neobodo designis TaxID=312471 RepID=A0A7S1KX12_NEODS|mmetsp:Transcript_10352/g.32054  ORF Transcript_10352/g.32054 Transcript_10352/m.32054 type:complete len:783 (+) Transcript_10352:59-2407(+)|eukprot:CAMPEP_0174843390 /NCGR_PEP_ID=MMETSP1114-20130205/10488_1 /TAXON_ID=312471 /ORGANISM="Neobodo designis, Strain CCAP 1951/1" /LENGTH=782 /DNA_ID=CAMNT_0016077607 /DNA_START=58 /DNA_END=2406 /DNA_ORIENTATION=-